MTFFVSRYSALPARPLCNDNLFKTSETFGIVPRYVDKQRNPPTRFTRNALAKFAQEFENKENRIVVEREKERERETYGSSLDAGTIKSSKVITNGR